MDSLPLNLNCMTSIDNCTHHGYKIYREKVHKIFGDILRSVTPYRTIYELTKNEVDAHVNVGIVSGLCRKALRDKLISIRDTE